MNYEVRGNEVWFGPYADYDESKAASAKLFDAGLPVRVPDAGDGLYVAVTVEGSMERAVAILG